MTKTALQWFEQLPEPIRTQAKDAFNDSGWSNKDKLYESLPYALTNWEWNEYWFGIFIRATKGEFDPPRLHGWIPVGERLPTADDADEFGHVLILREVNESQKNTCKSIIAYNMVRHCEKETTMWQPMPKLPEVQS